MKARYQGPLCEILTIPYLKSLNILVLSSYSHKPMVVGPLMNSHQEVDGNLCYGYLQRPPTFAHGFATLDDSRGVVLLGVCPDPLVFNGLELRNFLSQGEVLPAKYCGNPRLDETGNLVSDYGPISDIDSVFLEVFADEGLPQEILKK